MYPSESWIILFYTSENLEKVVGVFRSKRSAEKYGAEIGVARGWTSMVAPLEKRNTFREGSSNDPQI